MNVCDEIRCRLPLLVDGELAVDEQEDILIHLEDCASCRQEFEDAEQFSRLVRSARPQVQTPQTLRAWIEKQATLAAASREEAPTTGPRLIPRRRDFVAKLVMAAAAVLLVSVLGILHLRAGQGELMRTVAVQAQEEIEQHKLPLDITTGSSEQLSTWFASRVGFPFQMAESGMASNERAKYTLSGGRLINLGKARMALLSFQISGEPVSLLVGPGSFPVDSGGSILHTAGLSMHSRYQDGMHMVSWGNRGLSYVLVSRSAMNEPAACTRCHKEAAEPASAKRSGQLNSWLAPSAPGIHEDPSRRPGYRSDIPSALLLREPLPLFPLK